MSIRKFFTSAVILYLCFGVASGQNITLKSAGTLSNYIDNPAGVTSLTVNGPIDASDMSFIAKEMPGLTTLNLDKAVIEEYNGLSLDTRTFYPAATIPFGMFMGMPLQTVVLPSQQRLTIGDGAFMMTAITELPSLANVDSLGQAAFAGCTKLTNITMPKVARMGGRVFSDCTGLTTVDMGSATVIPDATFRGCTALTEVKGSANITRLGNQAFEGDTNLANFTFGKNLDYLGKSAFAATGLDIIDLDPSTKLKEIGDEAFADTPVRIAKLGNSITSVGNAAFFGTSNLESITMPPTLITLGDHALVGSDLPDIDLSEGVDSIGNYEFLGQKKIENLVLPSSLVYIGNNAMEGMTGLKTLDALNLTIVPELGENVWEGVNQKEVLLYVSENMKSDFENTPQWQNFQIEITTGVDNTMHDDRVIPSVRGRFYGTDLQLESTGSDIAQVRLYDTSGRLLAEATPGASIARIDTSAYPAGVFVITVTLDDNTKAILKLARK